MNEQPDVQPDPRMRPAETADGLAANALAEMIASLSPIRRGVKVCKRCSRRHGSREACTVRRIR